ncbi:MAG: cytochrome c family protein [Phycisphaerae bacterium]
MRSRVTVLLAVARSAMVVFAVTLPAPAGDESAYSYVGSKKCKKCHIKVHKSWAKTKMGQAFETLKPGQAKESKEKFKLDVDKDYTQDVKCLKCHTVGFGHEGGYVIPNPDDKKSVRAAKRREGVGCESCHGPGSEYVKVFDEIMKSKRKYKVEELYAVGLRKIDESTCTTCHNEESPTINPGDVFDYEKRKDEGVHEHQPLKQREG